MGEGKAKLVIQLSFLAVAWGWNFQYLNLNNWRFVFSSDVGRTVSLSLSLAEEHRADLGNQSRVSALQASFPVAASLFAR